MMSDGNKKISSKETGTVPKVKYWNNTSIQYDSSLLANNLTSSMLPNQERYSDLKRQRCSKYHCFEGLCVEDSRVIPNYNSLPYINMSGGTSSPSTSGSTSRRHSGGAIRKCDNITKYPKKHIEDKLNQIREYLKVTSSLMSSVKEDQSNADEHVELFQMLSALRDSEKKLEALLANKEISEPDPRQETEGAVANFESSDNGVPTLDTDPVLQTFQNNVSTQHNELEQKMEISEKKLHALHEHQTLLMRLQEKAENQLKDARKVQERLAAAANANNSQYSIVQQNHEHKNSAKNHSMDRSQSTEIELQTEQLGLLQSTTEGRGQLLRLLDARDNELCAEQHALQQKLHDLNNKKQQIDQLVSQLHCYEGSADSDDGDDMANQIRQIVAMKEQLATLKAVKSTEAALLQQNSAENTECGNGEHIPIIKSENVTKSGSLGLSDSEARSDSERRWGTMGKQSNKSSVSSSREQLLQAELQAKKQELEELMYKDQDRTSAINQDVCNELVMNKAEQSFSVESVPGSWTLLQDNTPPQETSISRENVYSSDEEELENYSQLNNVGVTKSRDYVQSNFMKQMPNRPVINSNPTIPDTASSPSVSHNCNFNHQWTGGDHKQQLELMTNLCQTLLEQHRQVMPNECTPLNFQWYTSYMQMQQSLMLSTMSQCCQLLWLQQQDINLLINSVTMIQQQHSKPLPTQNVSPPTNETVGSACSLPSRFPSNNTEYANLPPQGRASPQNLNRNLPVNVISQTHQSVWSGAQALNNQVAPGNRANNYWDNFRSYSRQNLLSTSTKSNEGSQNSLPMFERLNGNGSFHQPLSLQRSQPATLPKINIPLHESIACLDLNRDLQQEINRSTSRAERMKPTKRNRSSTRNRNEWNEETPQPEVSLQKSKLFEELRDNIYKEVTLLISANENRPHFLIQLFRDLQLISSDPLRRSALQSIQSLISRSLSDTSIPIRSDQCPSGLKHCSAENRIPLTPLSTPSRNKSETPVSRCCFQANPLESPETIKLDLSSQRILTNLLTFLRSHSDDIFHNDLIDILKNMIIDQCKPTASNNKLLQAKLDLVNEFLFKYKGKRIVDIKEDILKTVADILLDEMIASETINDHQNKKSVPIESKPKPVENIPIPNSLFLTDHNYTLPFESFQFLDQKGRPNFSNIPRVDNGDLAEADQSRREAENEEGAVGGILTNHAETQIDDIDIVSSNNDLRSDLDIFMNPHMNN